MSLKDIIKDIIYEKKCLGKNRKPLIVFKFRTMDHDADQRINQIVEEFDAHGHPIKDSRITPLGAFLRKYWIDELPQLYNLLKGNMKLVGIRPMEVEYLAKYPSDVIERALQQKPGLMGIQYAHTSDGDLQEHILHLTEYLDSFERNPLKTDVEYFFRVAHNIIINGTRSS
jgi:lipopolysaccharide/colanic/teichoic acid biosynthesis glycosyltransferase